MSDTKKIQFDPYKAFPSLKKERKIFSQLDEENYSFSIFGYPDDEGIKKNGGTPGALEAPDVVRSHLYKMTPNEKNKTAKIKDCGNLSFSGSSLEERHDFAYQSVISELKKEKRVLSFGGGHDYGYVDGLAFCDYETASQALVFNFDAHFDLRDLSLGITSGTPFFRLNESQKSKLQLFEIGIQEHCNNEKLFDYAHQNNIETLSYKELYPNHNFDFNTFKERIGSKTRPKQKAYVSIDIDGFKSSLAPGCSQSWPIGFCYKSFSLMLDYILEHFDVRILGIYEVSPPLDHNNMTSRLAALLAYRFLEV